jgi:uncharacterized protein
VTGQRKAEYDQICGAVIAWATSRPSIRGVAVVGSWARFEARMDSDIDLVVLTVDGNRYLTQDEWVAEAVGQPGEIVRTRAWGPLTERRVRLSTGLDVEFGFAEPEWAAVGPVDSGTAAVVREGCLILVDPHHLFKNLTEAV